MLQILEMAIMVRTENKMLLISATSSFERLISSKQAESAAALPASPAPRVAV